MILSLSDRQSKAAAIFLAGVLLIGVTVWVVVPVAVAVEARWSAAAILRKQLNALETLAASVPSKQASLAGLLASPDVQTALFRAPSTALAGAQLQGSLTQFVQAAGATLNAAQVLPEVNSADGVKLSVAINVTGPFDSQLKLLESIHTAKPVLSIARYALRDPDGDWAMPTQQAGPNALQAEITVTAYVLLE